MAACAVHNAPIQLVDYRAEWPALFVREANRVRATLGDRVLMLEHVGSTSVPGLAAKPIIDMILAVADSADEPAYVPAMESAGYVLHIREPEWHQHRLFKGPDTNINLHVYSFGCPEIDKMLMFRDWLRSQRCGPRALRARQARAGETDLEVRAELRRRQDRSRRGNRRTRPRRSQPRLTLWPRAVSSTACRPLQLCKLTVA